MIQLEKFSTHFVPALLGPEVDFVIRKNRHFLPIEVKLTDNPSKDDCRYLVKFMEEYPCFDHGYVVCQVARRRLLTEQIIALPWQEMSMFYEMI